MAEEFQDIFLCCRHRKPHQLVIRIGSLERQFIPFCSRCSRLISGIGIHTCKEQVGKLITALIVCLEVVAAKIISLVKLPVQSELYRSV